ncbi:MAG: hypothetical protein V3V01_13975 [Acidimicrobiales bacterium]
MSDSADGDELPIERAAVERIRLVHRGHLEAAQAHAERLAQESAEQTEDGIRDLADDDGEGEAAAQAVLVRQASARAMHAIRRVRDLEAAGSALAFGHITAEMAQANEDGLRPERTYVGRLSVIDNKPGEDDDDVLLVDWRAHAAAPFYRATPLDSLGVAQRRQFLYEGTDLVGYSDEVFDAEALQSAVGLRGEAAILATLSAPSDGRMKSVVATIQAEQDGVIRAPSQGALVVQGGPGTGKTVVALHRAAYLLYNQRAALAESGVLVVGPTTEFLGYISGVLPSLGETGVVSVTATELYPGIRLGRVDPPEVVELKGRAVMAELLAAGTRLRQRRPVEDLGAWYGSARVMVPAAELRELFDLAQRHRLHNDGGETFRSSIIDAFSYRGYDASFGDLEEARTAFEASGEIANFLLAHWPHLTPEQALNDLFGSPSLLRAAARTAGLSNVEAALLARERVSERDLSSQRWSDADVPLLDEMLAIVGGAVGGELESERVQERDEASEFELADSYDLSEDADNFLDAVDDEHDEQQYWSLEELAVNEEHDEAS